MGKAKVRKGAGLRKSVRINEACIVKSSLVAVHVIRGTVLSIRCTRIAAGDAVVVAGPGPAHCVANRDVDCIGHKHEAALSDRYIYNLTSARWHTVDGRSSVLIYNMDGVCGSLLLLRYGDASVVRFSSRQRYNRKYRCQQTNQSHSCGQ